MTNDIEIELTEYDVVITECVKRRAYVMAKDHENAVEIFDKLSRDETDIQDFDDEYTVDGDEI